MSTRRSPIADLLTDPSNSVFSHLTDMVKLGVKGRELVQWAGKNGIDLPPAVYDTRPVGDRGLLARVGDDEIILECLPEAPPLARIEEALGGSGRGIYRVEQQSATFELAGARALGVLAQTCGVNVLEADPQRVIFTRIAGVSCCLIPHPRNADSIYRIWVDYSYALYLGETLTRIISELK